MAWTQLAYTKGEIDRAGQILIQNDPPAWDVVDHMLDVINNWRAAHAYPLLAMRMTLTGRARRIDNRAVVAQRLKRLSSIEIKLGRNPGMSLSRMQDIGGCRAVVKTVRHVDKLVKLHEASIAKNPTRGHELVRKYDYIAAPKKDGYRGVHLVYKYRSPASHKAPWNGLRIELQLRSKLQHAWATAVETVDLFTSQAIKTGGGIDTWRRFFVLMGSAIAAMERRPPCPGTPEDPTELRRELRRAANELKVEQSLRRWADALSVTTEDGPGTAVYLLFIDAEKDVLEITGFSDGEQAMASKVYLETERKIKDRPAAQVVLVSAGSIQALRSAFPNYFADTRVFIDAVRIATANP
jgi:hypothetical protein